MVFTFMTAFRHKVTSFFILFVFLFYTVPATVYADNAAKLNNRGIKAYEEQNIEESVRQFTEALVERPDTPELFFNRGTALSSAGNTEEAVSELGRAATFTEIHDLVAAAHFNMGNTYLSVGDIENAVNEYKQAVTLDQLSEDYRKNLELALRMQQQQKQEQEQQENQSDSSDSDRSQEPSDSEQQQEEDSSEQNSEQSQQNEQNQQQQNQQNQQEYADQEDTQPMSPDEAQRILDAMKDEEDKAFELRRMQMQDIMRPGDDW